ncbi:sensor histidine kinase [Cnuibacter sp. UC19_7]|uniref:sensor histidine kinase n=1 Tax=Cnuibacter sp. UC19_7 TaxID=3350166 RepID=UPI00366EE8EC
MSQGSDFTEAARRSRVERAVFQSQLLVAGALLLLVVAAFLFQPESILNPVFFAGMATVFVLTGVSALVPWADIHRYWIALLPLVDIVAVILVRSGNMSLGAGLLLVFPVIWLASYFGVVGAVVSVATSSVALWTSTFLMGGSVTLASIPGLLVLPVTLTFVAAATFGTTSRMDAQRGLLRQQADLLEVALRRARRQEQTLDEVLNAVTFGVVAFDKDGKETISNTSARRLRAEFQIPEGAAPDLVAYGPDRTTRLEERELPTGRALRGERFDDVVMWLGDPGGHRIALSVAGRRLTTFDGESDGGVVISRDVTSELNAIQARDDLVASVSHELRTPLTSILGYLELALDDDRLDPSTRSMLEVASSNADRLLALVADLLTAASRTEQQIAMSFHQCELSEIVSQAIQAQGPAADERGIRLVDDVEGPIVLEADGFRLRQVIDNLLSNAIKYNRENGRVVVAAEASDDRVSLTVKDTGIGLSEVEQSKLFDRFFRAERVRNSTIHGSGLGLSISRDIVRRHGGELTVSSTLGVGTVFTATIPRRREHRDAAEGSTA